ncbi:ATP-binding protein (plasmid) [Methylobacterium currus]|uniref:ATP-binding protein n=1 Tax=Methylobacterium currus TaxID=2051553 RepID=UPI001E4ED207|nr:ATP-binding protein [Methylobacterium currus]UHC20106.1 ATP-binding protein [Methylobacterium currus]
MRADASQFETALVDLSVNARDAMAEKGMLTVDLRCGGPMPAIRAHAGAPMPARPCRHAHAGSPLPFVAVTVSDTGSGIAEEQTERIFEPFFTTRDVGKGTGPGLSRVIGFAKPSSGEVDVTRASWSSAAPSRSPCPR